MHERSANPTPVRQRAHSQSVLQAIAARELRRKLEEAGEQEWRAILAERQIATDHVQALGRTIGLRLTKDDVTRLRCVAEEALTDLDHGGPFERLCADAGHTMRIAAAEYLAQRCAEDSERSVLQVTAGDDRLAVGGPLRAEDWQALIAERWRLLPIMRPADVTDYLAARIGADQGDDLLAHAA